MLYLNSSNNLPGCQNDAEAVKSLLASTQKYDEVLVIDEETESVKVKEKLSNFIAAHTENLVEELFYYYTGHGDFFSGEFYYILSDYDESKRRQTALSNSELDNLLRQLRPKLTTKIIDACYSGVTYIKDLDFLNKYLNESKEGFDKCYFMFSSMADQPSYQNDISFSTKSFIDSILEFQASEIRYKDIIDYISDDFENKSIQTPFFVIQADFTEKFCSVTADLKASLSYALKQLVEQEDEEESTADLPLKDLIEKDAEDYCSKEEVIVCFERLRALIENYEYSSDLNSLYDLEYELREEYDPDVDLGFVGKWLDENENSYLARPIFSPYSSLLNVKKYTSFNLTVDVPYQEIRIEASTTYPNINPCYCIIVFVLSKTHIRFFYTYAMYREVGWDTYEEEENLKWWTREAKLKGFGGVSFTMLLILSGFDSFVMSPIKSKYSPASEEEGEDLEQEDTEQE